MTRRARIALIAVTAWYAIGLGHDALVRKDKIDVPYATVRCDGRLLNLLQWGESTCVGEVTGPLSFCERTVRSGCDWAFPGGYLTQFIPYRARPTVALCNVELVAKALSQKVVGR
jgi:hypothetical protein